MQKRIVFWLGKRRRHQRGVQWVRRFDGDWSLTTPKSIIFYTIIKSGSTAWVQSQHYAGVAFDVGQTLSAERRRVLWNSANNSGVWTYVEPISLTPTWVHFDKRFGTPACSTGGFPQLKRGSLSNYVLIAQDDLNTLGYRTNGLDGIFGVATQNAVREYQRTRGLAVDGIVGCNTWRSLQEEVVGAGATSTTIN